MTSRATGDPVDAARPSVGASARPRWVGRALRNKNVVIGGGLIAALVLVALFAPWLAPMDPHAQDIWARYEAPRGLVVAGRLNTQYVLGGDELGRDLLSRLVFGARVSLLVGFVATGLSLVFGVLLGAVAGYAGVGSTTSSCASWTCSWRSPASSWRSPSSPL